MSDTNLDLDAIRARAEAVPEGPWKECGHDTGGCECGLVWCLPLDATVAGVVVSDIEWDMETRKRIAAFIAHARIDIPALLDELTASREREGNSEKALRDILLATHDYEHPAWAVEDVQAIARAALAELDGEGE